MILILQDLLYVQDVAKQIKEKNMGSKQGVRVMKLAYMELDEIKKEERFWTNFFIILFVIFIGGAGVLAFLGFYGWAGALIVVLILFLIIWSFIG